MAFGALLLRDLKLAARIGGGGVLAVVFFALVITLVPFGVGPDPKTLARIAPGMVWVGLVLAALLSLDRLFQADLEDGSLDLLALGPLPLELVVVAKAAAHWLATGLPLLLAAPLFALVLGLPGEAYGALLGSLLLGTPALSLIGAVGAALTVGVRRGGLLLALLVLPLYVPIVIFGVSATLAATLGTGAVPANLALLGAASLGALALAPLAAAAALRLNLG